MLLNELRPLRQWVVHRADKLPLNPYTGQLASVTDSSTWSDYGTAFNCCNDANDIGLGFVLTEKDQFSVIDLDYTSDNASLGILHSKIAEAFNTYSEVSPSGKGLHIWCKGSVPSGKKDSKKKIEVYSSGRYFTVTLNPYQNVPIANRQELLTMLWQELGGKKDDGQNNQSEIQNSVGIDSSPLSDTNSVSQITDEELCRQAAQGANGNGDLFLSLYKGEWKSLFHSQSEADIALCNIIAFYSDDPKQVCRIFRSSGLGKRKKAQRDDYLLNERWGIVTKAFDQKGPELPPNIRAALEKENPIHVKDIPSVFIGDNWVSGSLVLYDSTPGEILELDAPAPIIEWKPAPGLMGMVAEFIYTNAVNPVKEVAIAASIAYLAGIAGRGYNISSTGLNHYVVLLANTSGGKEGAGQGMDKLTHAVREQVPAFEQFIGPAEIASPQGLIKQLVETPCFLSHKGEFGMWLQKLTSKYARGNETALKAMLLDLFTKSGFKQTLRGSVYSDRQKNVPSVDSPAFSLFGDSTQQEFYKAIDEVSIREGLIPRLTIIESNDARPQYNALHNTIKPTPELVYRLGALAKRCLELSMLNTPIDIIETPEATVYHTAYRELCTDRIYEDRDNAITQVWTRAHLRLLRLAGLIAVGCNPDVPTLTVEHLEWAKVVVEHGCERIISRFEAGKVGEVSYLSEQRELLKKTIYKFCKTRYSIKWFKAYGITREMHDVRAVTHRFLINNVSNHGCFRKDKNPAQSFRGLIQEFIDSGLLVKVDMSKIKASGKQGLAYYVTDLSML